MNHVISDLNWKPIKGTIVWSISSWTRREWDAVVTLHAQHDGTPTHFPFPIIALARRPDVGAKTMHGACLPLSIILVPIFPCAANAGSTTTGSGTAEPCYAAASCHSSLYAQAWLSYSKPRKCTRACTCPTLHASVANDYRCQRRTNVTVHALHTHINTHLCRHSCCCKHKMLVHVMQTWAGTCGLSHSMRPTHFSP